MAAEAQGRTGRRRETLWGGLGGRRRGVEEPAVLGRVRTARALAGTDRPGITSRGGRGWEGQVTRPSNRATSDDEASGGLGPRWRMGGRAARHVRAGEGLERLADKGATQQGGIGKRGLQDAEAGVDRPEGLGLGVHDAGEAEGEPLRVAQTDLVVQALGVGQEGCGGAIRGGVFETRGRVRVASQERAVCDQGGSVLGLGEGCLREGGGKDQPGDRTGRGCGGRGDGRSGDRERGRAHRARGSGGPARAVKRFSEVAARGG